METFNIAIPMIGLLLAQTVSAAESPKEASVRPVDLRCEYLVNPAGIDEKQPRLSWRLMPTDANAFGQRQTAYQVLVSDAPESLGGNHGPLWDSGHVASDQTTQVVYGGKPLTSRLSCFWKVRVKDERGVWSGWSKPARWTMGLLKRSDWTAQWIGSESSATRLYSDVWSPDSPAATTLRDPWLRRSFALDGKPQSAMLYIASVGYHEVYVNGQKVGDDVLAPPTTNLRRRAAYVTRDITALLRPGRNVIALWLGAGWSLNPEFRTEDRPQTPMAIAQAEILLAGGKSLRVVTDGTWKTRPSPNMLLGWWEWGKFGGEQYDAREETPGWNRLECDDSSWKPATVYSPNLALSGTVVEPDRHVEKMLPVEIREIKPGVWRADFGRCFAGMLSCAVAGKPGHTVEFLASEWEDWDDDLPLLYRTTYKRIKPNISRYIIGPSGVGVFQNRFNYFSGRWVTITGLRSAPKPGDIRAWRVRPGYEPAAQFECSIPLLNDIWHTSLWTFENLTVGGALISDPGRERVDTTFGNANVLCGLWTFRLGGLFTKWLADWRDVQKPDGGLPGGVAFDCGGEPCAPFSTAVMPWLVSCQYGDTRLLERNYSLTTGWLQWIDAKTKDNIISRYSDNPWHFLGDWVAPGCPMAVADNNGVEYADMPETQFFINCFHVYTLRTAARQAAALGRAKEAARYGRQADEVAAAVHKHFFKPDENSYVNGGQAYLAIALAAGVPPKELDAAVMSRLEKQILEHDKGRLNAGQLGLTFLFEVLHEHGRDDLVLRMMNTREYPGWGNMLARGGTTWWEDFEGHSGLQCFSYLHPPFWLMQAVAGLNLDPESPGFKRFVVKPGITGDPALTWAKCSYESECGRIVTGWRRENGRFELDVTVPPNTTATVYVPASGKASVSEARNAIGPSGAARWLRDEAGFVIFEVKPGRYHFVGIRL
jgi:alpha-L-rhamnosidase